MTTRYFSSKLFEFLNDLAENNNREWFKEHQDQYERYVREPALDFINDFATPLEGISSHFVADSRKVGGSLFRIQRDTRFAKDKTPYKENTGLQFRHASAKDVHAPGFYVNLQPGECYMGVGLWRPETKMAYAIREKIDQDPNSWKRATRGKRFTDVFVDIIARILLCQGHLTKRPAENVEIAMFHGADLTVGTRSAALDCVVIAASRTRRHVL